MKGQQHVAMKPGVPQAFLCRLLKQRVTVTSAGDGHATRMHKGKEWVLSGPLKEKSSCALNQSIKLFFKKNKAVMSHYFIFTQ